MMKPEGAAAWQRRIPVFYILVFKSRHYAKKSMFVIRH